MFDYLADCLKDSISKYKDLESKRLPFAFTFSFGYDQLALDKGIIKFGSIITDLSDVYDQDAVQLFRDAIERRSVNVDVLGIINDTTSTQVYGMYLKPGYSDGLCFGLRYEHLLHGKSG